MRGEAGLAKLVAWTTPGPLADAAARGLRRLAIRAARTAAAAAIHREGDDVGVVHVQRHERGRPAGRAARGARRARHRHAAVLGGNPARAICVAAERDEYDTIVVGRRNLRDAGRCCSARSRRASSPAPRRTCVVA